MTAPTRPSSRRSATATEFTRAHGTTQACVLGFRNPCLSANLTWAVSTPRISRTIRQAPGTRSAQSGHLPRADVELVSICVALDPALLSPYAHPTFVDRCLITCFCSSDPVVSFSLRRFALSFAHTSCHLHRRREFEPGRPPLRRAGPFSSLTPFEQLLGRLLPTQAPDSRNSSPGEGGIVGRQVYSAATTFIHRHFFSSPQSTPAGRITN